MDTIRDRQALVVGHAYSDGSGDFSAIAKLVKTLLYMGFTRENITLVMTEPNINESAVLINKPIDVKLQEFVEDYKGLDKLSEFDLRLLNSTQSNRNIIGITPEIIDDINHILYTSCTSLNSMHANKPPSQCNRLQLPSKEDLPRRLTDAELREAVKKVQDYILTVVLERHNYKENYPPTYKPDPSRSPENTKALLRQLWSDLNHNPVGVVNYSLYKELITSHLVNFLVTWKKNFEQFFIDSHLLPRENIYLFTRKEWFNLSLGSIGIDKENIFVLSFFYPTNKEIDELVKENKIAHLKLAEGGQCNKVAYSTGVSSEFNTCMGINIVDPSSITVEHNPYINTDDSYHLCYLGQGGSYLDHIMLLGVYKLKAFSMLLWKKYAGPRLVYLNDVYVTFILNNLDVCSYIVGDPVDQVDDDTFTMLSHTFKRYKRLTNGQFLYALQQSEDLCILTGDQSTYEGISLGKNIVYDIHPHKVVLFKQLFAMYKMYAEKFTLAPLEMIDRISKAFDEVSLIFLRSIGNISFRDFNRTPIYSTDRLFNIVSELVEEKEGTLEIKFRQPTDKRMSVNPHELDGSTDNKRIHVKYDHLYKTYELFMELSDLVLKDKQQFIDWLATEHNFDQHLIEKIESLL